MVELDGRDLITTRTTFVSLGTGDCNVPAVAAKVAESLDTTDVMVLLDNQNQEITDCPATQGNLLYCCPVNIANVYKHL